MSKDKISKPLVYTPHNAKINEGNTPMTPPETTYEDRKVVFNKEKVKVIVKGQYGREDSSR